MARQFTAAGRLYNDTPAGRLLAKKDGVAADLRLHGHQMMYWRKETAVKVPFFSARCGKCGAGVKVVTGRAPMKLPGYPSLMRLGRVRWCPGKAAR